MNIWVPKMKIIEPKQEILLPSQMAGLFKFDVYRPDGRRRFSTGWFPNLILDQGLNFIGTTSTWMNACRVGTGSTAPAAGQTNLVSHLAGTTTFQGLSVSGAQGSEPYYGYFQRTWRFSAGTAAGNLTEVGIGSSASDGSNLFSRALILDGSLNPTTLTVLPDEFLDVTYELRAYPPLVDAMSNIVIDSELHDVVARASSVTTSNIWSPSAFVGGKINNSNSAAIAYNGALGAITASPSGSSSSSTSDENLPYSDSSYQRDYTCTWGLNAGNLAGGITAFRTVMGCGAMQYSVSPAIAKDNTKTLSMTFRHTWARRP